MIKSNQGENLAREWSEDPRAPEIWEAMQLAKHGSDAGTASLEALAEGGSALSMMHLGNIFLRGQFGVEQDVERGERWLKRASDLGSIEGKYRLAKHLTFTGRPAEAAFLYQELAEIGYAPALFSLGVAYHDGMGVDQSSEVAYRYFDEAARKGHFYAAHWAAILLMKDRRRIGLWLRGLRTKAVMLLPFVRYNLHYPASDRLKR